MFGDLQAVAISGKLKPPDVMATLYGHSLHRPQRLSEILNSRKRRSIQVEQHGFRILTSTFDLELLFTTDGCTVAGYENVRVQANLSP